MKKLKFYFNSFGNKIAPNFPYEQLRKFKMVIQNNDPVLSALSEEIGESMASLCERFMWHK
jgi:hypothetical protein